MWKPCERPCRVISDEGAFFINKLNHEECLINVDALPEIVDCKNALNALRPDMGRRSVYKVRSIVDG
jgi:hypothetical protein